MVIQILLVILVLASFVVAYFSARTWHWSHVLVLLGLFLTTVGFFFLSAEALRINAVLRRQVNELETQLTDTKARTDALVAGTDDPALINQLRNDEVVVPEGEEEIRSLADLDHLLHLETRLRGRVWRNVAPIGVNPQTGETRVGIQSPTPAGIGADSVVFLFEQGEPAPPGAEGGAQRGPQYLGEFRVSEAAGQQATLEPVLQLDDYERQRLANSRGPWAIHESMPVDQHRIYAGMSEEELREILPAASVEEYLRHGQEAGPDDEWQRVGYDESGNRLGPEDMANAARVLYERRLRDYAHEFEELARRRVISLTDMAGVRQDNERLQRALASAKELQAFREDELRKLNTDLAGVTKEREAIETHLTQVQERVAALNQRLTATLAENSRLAQELADRQAALRGRIEGASSIATPQGPLALGAVN